MTAARGGAAAGGEVLAAALHWVRGLLDGCGIPFQLAGDVAAMAYGATRPAQRLELFIPAEHVPALIRAARETVVDYPWRRLDDTWDRVTLSLSHDGVTIDVCVVEAARFREAATGAWRDACIDPAASETLRVWNMEVPVVPRQQLLVQKRCVDREIDRGDICDITGAAP